MKKLEKCLENNSSQFHIPFLSNIRKEFSKKKCSTLKDFDFECLENKPLDWKVVLIFNFSLEQIVNSDIVLNTGS